MNRRRNLIILAVAFVLIVGVGAIAARPRGSGPVARTVTVAYGNFQTKLPETGMVQRPQTTILAALVAGNIARIYVRPGQHVYGGQLLATISNPQLINAEQDAHQAYLAAAGRAHTQAETNAVLPAQNRSSVVQAQASVEQARFNLNQAIQDQRSGAQSGLGYGGQSAAQQRAAADAQVANAATDLREAKRIADANQNLYAQKAVSLDTLNQSLAKRDQSQVAYDQAVRNRAETYAMLARQGSVLVDRVRAAHDALSQAQAQLTSAEANARSDKTGDLQAAQSDAAKAYADWHYAADQVARLNIVAPYAGIVQNVATETTDTLRTLQPGDAVTVGQAVVTMASNEGFVVRARVDEQDVAYVRAGQRAIVSGEDLGQTKIEGRVAQVGAVAQKSDDPSNTARQVLTTVALERTVPYLRDGMTVDVDIVTQELHHVIVLPADAIRRDPAGKPFVLVVAGNRTAKRPVTLGQTNDTQSVIRSGLSLHDVVVVDRNIGIVPGMTIQPTSAPSPSASATPGS